MYDILKYQVQGVHTPKTKAGFSKMLSLLEAADKLFNETGYFDVSVSDICKEAHTAVGTFYIYFAVIYKKTFFAFQIIFTEYVFKNFCVGLYHTYFSRKNQSVKKAEKFSYPVYFIVAFFKSFADVW